MRYREVVLGVVSVLLTMLVVSPLKAGTTYVSGIIDTSTAWTPAGSPYIVVGNTLIDSGVTLNIEPGVKVRIDSSLYIMIKGTLNAIGTEKDSIIFTRNHTSRWNKLDFKPGSSGILKYCRVEYAGGSAVYGNSASLVISNCTLVDNESDGGYSGIYPNYGGGILVILDMNSLLSISNNVITRNNKAGIQIVGSSTEDSSIINENIMVNNAIYGICSGNCSVLIRKNFITNNKCGIYILDGAAIIDSNFIAENTRAWCGGIWTHANWTIIRGNIIIGNEGVSYGGAMTCVGDSLLLNDNIIAHNSGEEGGAIYCGGNWKIISNNILVDNSATKGGAIYWCGGSGIITNNIIVGNHADAGGGFYGSNVQIKYNTFMNNSEDVIYLRGASVIHHCNFIGNSGYIVHNGSECYIDATNNYWGTTGFVDALIYDYYDDFNLGVVYYEPFLALADTVAPVPFPLNFAATKTGPDEIMLSWDSVNISDLLGYEVYYDTDSPGFPYDGKGAKEGDSPIDVGNVTTFKLTGLTPGENYYIAVTAYDREGNESWYSNEASVTLVGVKESRAFEKTTVYLKVYPNPFLTYTKIYGASGKVEIYDISGRLVGKTKEGIWNGKDFNGRECRSGIYFLGVKGYRPVKIVKLR